MAEIMETNPVQKRPLAITIFVAVSLLAAGVGFFKGLTMKDELIAQHPRLEPPMFWIYFAVIPLTIVGAVGLWMLLRWGFYLKLALTAVVIGIDLWVGMEWQHPATVAAMGGVLLAVTLPYWSRLSGAR